MMTPSGKPKGIDVAALKQQTAGPLGTAIALNAFCHQLKMLAEQLQRYAPGRVKPFRTASGYGGDGHAGRQGSIEAS